MIPPIMVGDKADINRKLGMDFQGAPEIADMLSLKCKRRRAEQKYIGFMGIWKIKRTNK